MTGSLSDPSIRRVILNPWRYLRLFRGVPGAPARPAVPVDRHAELERELEPVFTSLAAAQKDGDDIVAQAKAQAERRRSDAAQKALRIVEDARARADEARTRTASAEIDAARATAEGVIKQGRAEAESIDAVVRERLAATIDDLIARAAGKVS